MTLPPNVREGFNRDSDTADIIKDKHGIDGFCPAVRPAEVGQHVKIGIHFRKKVHPRPDYCSLDRIDSSGHFEPRNCRWAVTPFNESAEWFILSGPVSKVEEKRVEAIVRPSTMNAPLDYEQEWAAVLTYDDDFEYPWVLTSLTPWEPS